MKHLASTNFERYIREGYQVVRPIADFMQEIYALEERGPEQDGIPLPWSKTHTLFRLRPREVTVIAGTGGSGKSSWCGMVALDHACKGHATLVVSLEMDPAVTGRRMLQQYAGQPRSTPQHRAGFEFATDNLYLYTQTGVIDRHRLLGMLHFAGQELKAKLIVIDALFMVGLKTKDSDDYPDFIRSLCYLAKQYDTHILLVHHLRKGDDPNKPPNSFDLRGHSELRDAADNVLLFWKDQKKIDRKQEGEHVSDSEGDNLLIVDKQRNGTHWTGKVQFYYDHPSDGFKQGPYASDRVQF